MENCMFPCFGTAHCKLERKNTRNLEINRGRENVFNVLSGSANLGRNVSDNNRTNREWFAVFLFTKCIVC